VLTAALVVVAVTSAIGVAARPQYAGSWKILVALGVPYAVTAALSLWRMHRRGEIRALLRPRSGDLTYGAVAAAMLFFGALFGRLVLAPHGTGREGWLVHIYLQIGDPEELQRHFVIIGVAVVLLAAFEEITWRGHVYGALKDWFGVRRAWPIAAVLYALAHAPTIILLRDQFAGYNPLLFICALGCGLVWGLIVAHTERLPVAIFSHALFLWVVTCQFPLWRLG
jgi:membrane protease YdiL (CAAX protease family)